MAGSVTGAHATGRHGTAVTPGGLDDRPRGSGPMVARWHRPTTPTSSTSPSTADPTASWSSPSNRPDVLNAANVRMHREMSEVWAVVDADPDARVSVVTGAGRAFSAGGDLDMIEEMTKDYAAVLEQWRDARTDGRVHARRRQADRVGHQRCGGRAGLAVALLADVSIMGRVGPPVRRPRPPGGGRRRPCRAAVAVAVRHGQGQVLPDDGRLRRRTRGRADRPGDAVRARRRGARRGAGHRRRAWRPGAPPPCSGRGGS